MKNSTAFLIGFLFTLTHVLIYLLSIFFDITIKGSIVDIFMAGYAACLVIFFKGYVDNKMKND